MKGLRQFATRPVDDAIARRLLECVTCVEADPKDPASFDALRDQLDKLEAARKPAATACSIWRRRRAPSCRSARELGRTGMLKENGAWRRLVVEKPFGTDLASAKALNGELLKLVDRAPDLPDRSLSRQGDRPEHPGAALRQRHVRADLESQPHRPHPDHGRREARRRPSRQLLRRHRRAARHGAEPSVPAAVAGRDGAADPNSTRIRCARKRPKCWRRSRPRAKQEALHEFGARAISGRQDRRHRDRGLSQDRGRQARTAPPRPTPR